MTNPEKQQTKQGWIQTGVVLLGLVATILLSYGKIDAKADEAIKTAGRAEVTATEGIKKIDDVKESIAPVREELVRIRTILDERLPKSTVGTGDK